MCRPSLPLSLIYLYYWGYLRNKNWPEPPGTAACQGRKQAPAQALVAGTQLPARSLPRTKGQDVASVAQGEGRLWVSRGLCQGSWQGDPPPGALCWWPEGIPSHPKALGQSSGVPLLLKLESAVLGFSPRLILDGSAAAELVLGERCLTHKAVSPLAAELAQPPGPSPFASLVQAAGRNVSPAQDPAAERLGLGLEGAWGSLGQGFIPPGWAALTWRAAARLQGLFTSLEREPELRTGDQPASRHRRGNTHRFPEHLMAFLCLKTNIKKSYFLLLQQTPFDMKLLVGKPPVAVRNKGMTRMVPGLCHLQHFSKPAAVERSRDLAKLL